MPSENRFGGVWTRIKLDTLQGYLEFFTTALKNKGFKLHYIDAFAGSGMCEIKDGDRTERLIGSARRAIEITPQFDRLEFIESDQARAQALQQLTPKHPGQDIRVYHADANEKLRHICAETRWQDTRAVLFIDPFGMSLDYETLKIVAKTQAIDVWYLFPLSALFRQAAIRLDAVTPDKAEALTRLLGDDSWREILYERQPITDMFDGDQYLRDANVDAIEDFALYRLAQIFPKVAPPRRLLYNDKTPLFSLIFAVSNPSPKAIGLSLKAANHLLKAQR